MLAGAPAYRFKMRAEDDVRSDVRHHAPAPLNRGDLSADVSAIVTQAIERNPANRQPDVRTLAKALRVKFGEVPPERKGRRLDRRFVAAGVAIVLLILILVIGSNILANSTLVATQTTTGGMILPLWHMFG
jgi:hypothetical protein